VAKAAEKHRLFLRSETIEGRKAQNKLRGVQSDIDLLVHKMRDQAEVNRSALG